MVAVARVPQCVCLAVRASRVFWSILVEQEGQSIMTDSRKRGTRATPLAGSSTTSRALATAELVRELTNPAAVVLANLDVLVEILSNIQEDAPASVKAWLATSLREADKPLRDARDEAAQIQSIASQLRRLAPVVDEEAAASEDQRALVDAVQALQEPEVAPDEPPLADEGAESLSLPPPPIAQPSADAKVVLVIEDDAEIRFMVSRALGRIYTVYQANDGQEAAELLEKIPNPDAVVCDIMMPRLDGLALAKRMRADARLSKIPIVFLTARDRFQDVVEGINVGARHYLKKPVKLTELMEKVAHVVGAPTFARRS